MKLIKLAIAITLTGLALVATAAPEFAVTQSGNTYIFDYAADEKSDITSLQFDVELPAGAQVNSANCVSGLSGSHIGACSIKANGNLRVIVYSSANEVLPTTNIGSITVNSTLRGDRELSSSRSAARDKPTSSAVRSVKVIDLIYANTAAEDIPGEALQ